MRYYRYPILLISLLIVSLIQGQVPSITKIEPLRGRPGDIVKITGTNFNTLSGWNAVYFGTLKAEISASAGNELYVKIPAGAVSAPVKILNTANGLSVKSPFNFIVGFISANASDIVSLQGKQPGFAAADWGGHVEKNQASSSSYAVVSADIDGDNKSDIILSNVLNNTISVYRNKSQNGQALNAASFADPVNLQVAVGSLPIAVAVEDIDGDGAPDIVSANNTNQVSIFRNISSPGNLSGGSFEPRIDINLRPSGSPQPQFLAIHDMNNDGRPDILVAMRQTASIAIIKNISQPGVLNGSSFAASAEFQGGTHPSGLAVGDFNGDGKPDMIDVADNTIVIFDNKYLADINGDFIDQGNSVAIPIVSPSNYMILTEDIDEDGRTDFFLGSRSQKSLLLFRNTYAGGAITAGQFTQYSLPLPFYNSANPLFVQPSVGDIDGDKKPDILIPVSNYDSLFVYLNKSVGGTFTEASFSLPVGIAVDKTPRGHTLADLNGDGRPDLATAGFQYGNLSLLENRMPLPPVMKLQKLQTADNVSIDVTGTITSGSSAAVLTVCYQPISGGAITEVSAGSFAAGTISVGLQKNIAGAAPGKRYLVWLKAENDAGIINSDTLGILLKQKQSVDAKIISANCSTNQQIKFSSSMVPRKITWYKDGVKMKESLFGYLNPGELVLGASNGFPVAGLQFFIDPLDNLYFTSTTQKAYRYSLTDGSIAILAGSGGQGTTPDKTFNSSGFAVDAAENLYINDFYNTGRLLYWPRGAAFSRQIKAAYPQDVQQPAELVWSDDTLYTIDFAFNRIMRWTNGVFLNPEALFGGTAPGATLSQLNSPSGLVKDGNVYYIADSENDRVLQWRAGEAAVVVAGGNGRGPNLNQLNMPRALCLDSVQNMYIADEANYRIVVWRPGELQGRILVAGTQGTSISGKEGLHHLQLNSKGELFAQEVHNHRIVKHKPTIDSSFSVNAAGVYRAVAEYHDGQTAEASVQILSTPTQPPAFTQSTTSLCSGTKGVIYTVPVDPTVQYSWSYSGSGVNLTASNNTVVADFQTNATSGTLSVTASKNGCISPGRSVAVNVLSTPQPGAFTSATLNVCQPISKLSYSVPEDPGSTYQWSYSGTGAVIQSTLNAALIDFSAAATDGILSVSAVKNGCTSLPRTITLHMSTPSKPGLIQAQQSLICGGNTDAVYSVPPVGSNSYQWQYSGNGVTMTAQNNQVTLHYGATPTSGVLSVTGVSQGCVSSAQSLPIDIKPLPMIAGQTIGGPLSVCRGQSGANYTVSSVDPGLTYHWTYSSTGAVLHPSGGQVSIDFDSSAVSGTLAVFADNGCPGPPVSISVSVGATPSIPVWDVISKTSVCSAEQGVYYSVQQSSNVVYEWTYSGQGVQLISAGNSVQLNFSPQAVGGELRVRARSAEGCVSDWTAVTLAIQPAIPFPVLVSQPTGGVCAGNQNVLFALDSANAGTVTYQWNYSSNGAIIKGQGNAQVLLDFSDTATSGVLQVITQNQGCTSPVLNIPVQINALPASATQISGPDSVCAFSSNIVYSAGGNADDYMWSISGGQTSLYGNGKQVSASFGAAGTGTITVYTITKGCVSKQALQKQITVKAVPELKKIIASDTSKITACYGDSIQYVTDPTGGKYEWSFTGSGVILSPENNTVTLSFQSGAQSGTLSVTAEMNGCTSKPLNEPVNVNTAAYQAAVFSSFQDTVCAGSDHVLYQTDSDSTLQYQWKFTGNAVLSALKNRVYVTFPDTAVSGTLEAQINAAGCPVKKISRPIIVKPAPQVSGITGPAQLCLPQGPALYKAGKAGNGEIYTWSYSGKGVLTNASGDSAVLFFSDTAQSGDLKVIADLKGCLKTHSIPVKLFGKPIIGSKITGVQTICAGSGQTYNYTVYGDTAQNYLWSFTGKGFKQNWVSNEASLQPWDTAIGGVLQVVSEKNGCYSDTIALSISVVHPQQPGGFLQYSDSVCAGSIAQYSVAAIASDSLIWDLPGNQIITQQNQASINFPNSPGMQSLSVTGITQGCKSKPLTKVVTVLPLPPKPAGFSVFASELCAGQTNIVYQVNNPGPWNYQWSYTGNGLGLKPDKEKCLISADSGATSGLLKVAAENAGCKSDPYDLMVKIAVVPASIDFDFPPTCVNQPVTFFNTTTTGGFSGLWIWDYGNNTSDTSYHGKSLYGKAGNFAVTLKAVPAACPLLAISKTKYFVPAKPVASMVYDTIVAVKGQNITLKARPFGIAYQWSPAVGMSSPFTRLSDVTVSGSRQYAVKITDSSGCAVVDSQYVHMTTATALHAPNAFTPNGDGINDRFFINEVGVKSVRSFRIINQWGNVVFERKASFVPADGWDGRFRGALQPAGTYHWLALWTDVYGQARTSDGSFLLIR